MYCVLHWAHWRFNMKLLSLLSSMHCRISHQLHKENNYTIFYLLRKLLVWTYPNGRMLFFHTSYWHWLNEIWPYSPKLITWNALEVVSKVTFKSACFCFYLHENLRLGSVAVVCFLLPGYLVTDVLDKMIQLKKKQLRPARKLFIYSGHDVTLVNVMRALDIISQTSRKPDFASALHFELHHNPILDNDSEVKVIQWNFVPLRRTKMTCFQCGFLPFFLFCLFFWPTDLLQL